MLDDHLEIYQNAEEKAIQATREITHIAFFVPVGMCICVTVPAERN